MIELNDFTRQWAEIGPEVLAAVERVGRSGRYILGPEVTRFERELARLCRVTDAVGVANGMDAIEVALRVLGLRKGQRVVTTPFSAFATTLAIVRAGGVPVFADVDDNGNIDLAQARELFAREKSLRFFVPVHLYGNPVDLDQLAAIKRDFDVAIVEDCAQAIGAAFAGRQIGTVGSAAAISFYPTKNLGALGDAGALLTTNASLARRACALRNYGQSAQYRHDGIGLNSRLDELHAAVLHDALLPRLAKWTARRRDIAANYRREIASDRLTTLNPSARAEAVWHLFPVFVPAAERERFRELLCTHGIATAIHYPTVITDQPAMQLIPFEVAVEPKNARRLAASEISLPIHPFLSEAEVAEVSRACATRPQAVARSSK